MNIYAELFKAFLMLLALTVIFAVVMLLQGCVSANYVETKADGSRVSHSVQGILSKEAVQGLSVQPSWGTGNAGMRVRAANAETQTDAIKAAGDVAAGITASAITSAIKAAK